jgi:hypothetical protein
MKPATSEDKGPEVINFTGVYITLHASEPKVQKYLFFLVFYIRLQASAAKSPDLIIFPSVYIRLQVIDAKVAQLISFTDFCWILYQSYWQVMPKVLKMRQAASDSIGSEVISFPGVYIRLQADDAKSA